MFEYDPVANIIDPKLIESVLLFSKVIFVPIIILFEPIPDIEVLVWVRYATPALYPIKVE